MGSATALSNFRRSVKPDHDSAKWACEQKLGTFIRQAWNVVEPATAFLHNWHLDLIAEYLEAVTAGQIKRLLMNVPPRYMKKIADSVPVLSANRGWITHGDLRVGDSVFGLNGHPTKITAVSASSPVTMEIETIQGAIIKAHAEHDWVVYDRILRRWRTMETQEFIARAITRTGRIKLIHGQPGKRGAHCRFLLPCRGALEYPTIELPIPPYVLGAWLGDGTTAEGTMTYGERKRPIQETIGQDFESGNEWTHPRTGVLRKTFYGLRTLLREHGLLGNKHIPEIYQRASIRQRLDLLAGLIDTDGHVDDGRVIFVNTNPRIIEGMVELVRGLGWHAATVWVDPPAEQMGDYQRRLPACYLSFTPDRKVGTKLDWKQPRGSRAMRRVGIRDVRMAAEPETGHCITVANPDGLYLVGRELVPTHNSKSVSVFWPTWCWARRPEQKLSPDDVLTGAASRWIFASYADELVMDHSMQRRRIMASPWYQQRWGDRVSFSKDQNRQRTYQNTKQGVMLATSISGSAGLGKGGNAIVVDDPHNTREAESDADRTSAIETFRATLSTRHDDKRRGVIVVIMQRLNELDLSGYLLELGGWEHLLIQGEYEEKRTYIYPRSKNVIERFETHSEFKLASAPAEAPPKVIPDGGLLWPEREGPKEIEERKIGLGGMGFASQYQGRPAPKGGALFKHVWWRYWRTLPRLDRIIMVADTAYEEGDDNSYSNFDVWGYCELGFVLCDNWHRRVAFPELKRAAIWMAAKWKPEAILIEARASGRSLIQELKRPPAVGSNEPTLQGSIPVTPIEPELDKYTRAVAVTPIPEAGLVWFPDKSMPADPMMAPEGYAWVDGYEHELELFPAGKLNDRVDTFVHAITYLRGQGSVLDFYRRLQQHQDAVEAAQEAVAHGRKPKEEPNSAMEAYKRGQKMWEELAQKQR